MTKLCHSCGTVKGLEDFSKASSRSDGRQATCKVCVAQYHADHKAESRAYKAAYYVENRERVLAQGATHYAENKEQYKVSSAAYYKGHKEAARVYGAAYSASHRDERKARDMGPASFSLFSGRLTVEEDPKEDLDGTLLARCSLCKDYFTPNLRSVQSRVSALIGKKKGEHRLYCGDKCKSSCPIYRAQTLAKDLRPAAKQSRCNQATNRKALMVIQRDHFGSNHCEKCGTEGDSLDLHHGILVSENHKEADNMAHQLLLCKSCHLAVHHSGACA